MFTQIQSVTLSRNESETKKEVVPTATNMGAYFGNFSCSCDASTII